VTFEYVQTWMVREGYEDEHDALLKSWILKIGGNPSLRSVRFPPTPRSLPRKRILVYVFEDVHAWRRFREETLDELRAFVRQWLQLIELDTFRIFFWRDHEND